MNVWQGLSLSASERDGMSPAWWPSGAYLSEARSHTAQRCICLPLDSRSSIAPSALMLQFTARRGSLMNYAKSMALATERQSCNHIGAEWLPTARDSTSARLTTKRHFRCSGGQLKLEPKETWDGLGQRRGRIILQASAKVHRVYLGLRK